MNEKPNVTVIYQDAPKQTVGCTQVLAEIAAFAVIVITIIILYKIF